MSPTMKPTRRLQNALVQFPWAPAGASFLAGVLMVVVVDAVHQRSVIAVSSQASWVGIAVAVVGVLGLLMGYLQTGFRRMSDMADGNRCKDISLGGTRSHLDILTSGNTANVTYLQDQIDVLDREVMALRDSSATMSENSRADLVAVIRSRLTSEAYDQIVCELQEKAEKAFRLDARLSVLDHKFASSLDRLQREVEALTRRGNLNLVLGIATTAAGLGVLGYYVIHTNISMDEPLLFLCHFLPRLTLVVFIEIFAYFFLSLYRTTLTEIKYFQNEMTNVEAKSIALNTSVQVLDKDAADRIVQELVRTERNYIPRKGRATVGTERTERSDDMIAQFAATLIDAVRKKAT